MDLSAPVSTIMSTDLKCVAPTDPVARIDELFKEYRIHHVPVVSKENNILGVISKSDFLFLLRGFTDNDTDRFRKQAMLRAFKVAEIMTKEVTTIHVDDTIKKAVEILAENRFRSLPVIDDEGVIRGIVTTHDIVDLVNREMD